MKDLNREEIISLLWPEGTGMARHQWPSAKCGSFAEDLNLSELAQAVSYDQFHPVTVDKLMTYKNEQS